MIRKIKQKVRNYFTLKYDACYQQELDRQVQVYDTWIREKEAKEKEQKPEIIWDLSKEEAGNLKKNTQTAIFSYVELEKISEFEKKALAVLQEADYVILTQEPQDIRREAFDIIKQSFEKHPEAEVVYGDEEEINSNGKIRMNPWLKPDYSPDTLHSYFYFGSLVAFRKESFAYALKKLCERKEKNGQVFGDEEDSFIKETIETGKKNLYALVLESCLNLRREQVLHLKHMLVSSHNITYWGYEKEYDRIRAYYLNLREREEVKGISIIIPSKDNPKVLERCLYSIAEHSKDRLYEIIVVDNGSDNQNKAAIENLQQTYGFQYLYEAMEFNFSKMCNKGAHKAKYDTLLFLNDDCEVRMTDWLNNMTRVSSIKDTGAVGAKLYYPESRRIQHCGIYNIHLGPVHKLQFKEDDKVYYDRKNLGVRNVLAVTAACLMVRKSVFMSVGGFDEELQVAFNDVDLCYKLYEAGYNNVVNNEVYLWHYESLSRGSDESPAKLKRLMEEKKKLYDRHKNLWEQDPYYHPDFTTDILDTGYSFAFEYPRKKGLEVEHPQKLLKLPTGVRKEECVVPMIEYAGNLKGWFLKSDVVKKTEEKMQTSQAAYLQGNVVILGSDNACYEKSILLKRVETDEWYQIIPGWYYRPDILSNLPDQENVALSGFACLVNMSQMPKGKYEVAVLAMDKISKQYLLRTTTRSLENL